MEGDTKTASSNANLQGNHRVSEQKAGPAAATGFRAKNLLPKARRFFLPGDEHNPHRSCRRAEIPAFDLQYPEGDP